MNLSKPQLQVMSHAVSDKTVCIATGAMRGGKTTGQHLGFTLWAAEKGVGFDHALIGKTVESAMTNVGNSIINDFLDLGIPARFDKSVGHRIIFRHGGHDNVIRVLGATNSGARQRVQGSTLKGLLIDELTNIGEDMFNTAYSRLSIPGSKLWATTNPESPAHWAKRTVIDRLKDFNGVSYHFHY